MRQLVLPVPPDRNGSVILKDREYKYLVQVLRKAQGDRLEVRLPDGSLLIMRVDSIDRHEKTMRLVPDGTDFRGAAGKNPAGIDGSRSLMGLSPAAGESMPSIADVPEGFPVIVLFQWILKGPRMDQVIRQATETGVGCIVPVAGERCLSSDAGLIGDGKTGRWDRIVREARQQSGSPVSTRILPPVAPADIRALWQALSSVLSAAAPEAAPPEPEAFPAAATEKRGPVALVLTEAPLARKSLHEYLGTVAGPAALAVGPEGGMTSRELGLLEEAGFACVHFKTNILRAETAALYGIAAVQSALLESVNWQLKE